MTELARARLWHFLSLVALVVNKLNTCIYGHKTRLRLKRYIFKSLNSYAKWIELFTKETRHQRQIAFNCQIEFLDSLSL